MPSTARSVLADWKWDCEPFSSKKKKSWAQVGSYKNCLSTHLFRNKASVVDGLANWNLASFFSLSFVYINNAVPVPNYSWDFKEVKKSLGGNLHAKSC